MEFHEDMIYYESQTDFKRIPHSYRNIPDT